MTCMHGICGLGFGVSGVETLALQFRVYGLGFRI